MKLKRILSLALSGVLAVSMLTACGIGGGSGILGAGDQSRDFAKLLNSKLDEATAKVVEYKNSDYSNLKKTVQSVADTLEANQVINGAATGAISSMAQQMTKALDMNLDVTDGWTVSPEDRTHVKIFVYDADDDRYNTLDEAATAVKTSLDKMKLGEEKASQSTEYTNEYSGYVAARATTIKAAASGEEDTHAWVIGVILVQDSEPVASSDK